MAQAKGSSSRLRLGYETTFGVTPGTPATFQLPFNPSLELAEKQALNESGTIIASRNTAQPFLGYKSVEGSVTVPVDATAFGYWLKGLFGAPVTTGTGPYTHVFSVSDSIPSMFIEKAFTDISEYYVYNGVKANTMEISFGGDDELVAAIGLLGATGTNSSTEVATPSSVALDRFFKFQASIVGATMVKNVTVSMTNNLDGDQYTIDNGASRGNIPEGMLGVSGTLDMLFEDNTKLAAAQAGTPQALTITLTSGTDSLEFDIPELLLEPTGITIDSPLGLMQSFNYRGYWASDVGASVMTVTLINSVATY